MTITNFLTSKALADNNHDGVIDLSSATKKLYNTSLTHVKFAGMVGSQFSYVDASAPVVVAPPPPSVILLPVITPPTMPAKPEVRNSGVFSSGGPGGHDGFTANGEAIVFEQKNDVPLHDCTLRNFKLTAVGVLFRNGGGPLTNMLIENGTMIGRYAPAKGRGVFQSTDATSNITIRNITYTDSDPITNAGDIYGGITLAGKGTNSVGSNFLFEDLDMRGFITNYTGSSVGKYANCDGIVVEGGYTDGVVRRVYVQDCSDSGFDCKGARWVLDSFTAKNARQTIKMWTSNSALLVNSINPRVAHILIAHAGVNYDVKWLVASGTDPKIPLVAFENGISHVVVHDGDFTGLPAKQVWATADHASKGSTLTLPDGTVVTP